MGVYHDELPIVTGSVLIDAAGGTVSRDGISLRVVAGTFAGPTLVRIQADPSTDWATLWPELSGKGRIAASFAIDCAGTIQKGLELSLADLGTVADGIAPILVQLWRSHSALSTGQRFRSACAPLGLSDGAPPLHGERKVVAVGAFSKNGTTWTMASGWPAILEAGSFAVVVPTAPWASVSGTATIPKAQALKLQEAGRKLNRTARNDANRTSEQAQTHSPDQSIHFIPFIPVNKSLAQTGSQPMGPNPAPSAPPASSQLMAQKLINRDEGDKRDNRDRPPRPGHSTVFLCRL